MIDVETRPFDDADGAAYVELAARAFARSPPAQRPRDTVERVVHLHGSRNPAGRAVVTLARLDGRVVGHASGLPARFLARDGVLRTGWQIGCFVVDPDVQRQGVGRAIVDALTSELAARAGSFVHTFPNPRSTPAFLRRGFVECASAPTRIVVGSRRAATAGGEISLGGGASGRALDVAAAADAVRTCAPASSARGAFVRDAAWFTWRFLDPAVAPAYRFARFVDPRAGEHVVAIARHAFRGLEFSVLADASPALDARTLPIAVRCAAAFGASRLVYATTNLPAVGSGLTALGTRIPERFDPRPVRELVLPGGAVDAHELGGSPIQTADWMGF